MNDYEQQQLQEVVAALRTDRYTSNDSDLRSRGNVEHSSSASTEATDNPATTTSPTQVLAGDAQGQSDLIDGQLLEAVTSASAVDEANTLVQLRNAVEEQRSPRSASFDRQSRMAEEAVSLLSPAANQGKRKRTTGRGSNTTDNDHVALEAATTDATLQNEFNSKKQKIEDVNNNELSQHDQSDLFLPHDQLVSPPVASPPEEDNIFVAEYPQNSTALSDARIAAGIYSAAALFRKPNTMTKKYTRPPMSKLFADLELTPENFLQLQAQAKNYMLEEAHPERRECVGNRTKGETDMNKLKLFHCVREFLEPELGTLYFGPNSEGADRRKWSWPEDVNKVIAAVTPLLRRMVTNERQRQYANESRKGGGKKKAEQNDSPAPDSAAVPGNESRSLDPTLGYRSSVDNNATEHQPSDVATDTLLLHFIVMSSSTEFQQAHIVARFECPASMCATYSSLQNYVYTATAVPDTQAVESSLSNTAAFFATDALPMVSTGERPSGEAETTQAIPEPVMPSISAFLPSSGLSAIKDEVDWSNAVKEARNTIWLEQTLRIVVQNEERT